MSGQKLKAGDVVQLKSGGPKMTIQWIGKDYGDVIMALCQWFDGKELKDGKFSPDQLKPLE